MKNLKRALSFALASVMLVGMMVVGASAASFGDADKIVNTDAVNTLVSLGVIKGKDTGNFDPEGIVTRAEMAKMICVALNSGKDPNLTGGGLYPDTKNHWASGYIDYCANQGIVSGDTAGNFNPDKTVTGTEAAKMILIALGFNAENEKFVNDASWATNIGVRASQKGLYADLAILPSEGLTRDSAAQMIWNGLDAEMVEYDYKLGTSNGDLTSIAIAKDITDKTILLEKFSLTTKYGYMTSVSYDDVKEEYTYTLDDGTTFGLASGDLIAKDDKAPATLKSENDYSMFFGQQVKALYKLSNSKTTVYGLYSTDTEVLYEGVGNDLPGTITATADSVKLDGTTYKLTQTANKVKVFPYNMATTGTLNDGLATELAFKLIDNTGDGKADVVVTYPVTVAKVTFVGKDSITVGGGSYKYDDATIYEDVKKDDYAVVTKAENTPNDTPVIVKAELVTGSVDATRTGEVKIDGTWYTDATAKSGDAYKIGDTFEVVMVNGFVFHAKKTSTTASAKDSLYILGVDKYNDEGTKKGKQTAEVLFADGSKKIVTVAKCNIADTKILADVADGNNLDDKKDTIYTYAVDKNGNYELSQIKDGDYDATGAADGTHAIAIKDGKASSTSNSSFNGTLRFNDDAVVFVKGSDKVKALSGATINKWAAQTTTATVAGNKLYANAKDGFNYVELGIMTVSTKVPGVDGDLSYGWITGTPSLVKDGDDYYISVSLWNGTEDVTVLAESTVDRTSISSSTSNKDVADDANVQKGTPVSYKDLGADKVSDVTSLKDTSDAITGYAGGKDVEFLTAGAAETDDDTVIVYVNTADNKGVEGGALAMADKDALGNYIKNVYAAVDGGKVTYVIIDVANNNLDQNTDDKAITEIKDMAGSAKSMMAGVDADKKTINIDGFTVAGMLAKVTEGESTFVSAVGFTTDSAATTQYTVIKNGSSEVTALEVGDVVRIVAGDGSSVDYTVINVKA